jgi:hypothetical protein
MESKSSLLINAMAESRIMLSNLLRCWTASSDVGSVFVAVKGKARDSTSLLDNASRMLLLKDVGWVPVLCVGDGGFMVVDDNGFSEWSLRTVV